MDIFSVILIGVALAMDASAVTIANCTSYGKQLNRKKEWSMPVAFTLFQVLMPVLGFYIGFLLEDFIAPIADYLTAGVFFILAVKIVLDNITEMKDNDDSEPKKANFTFTLLIIQAISTSLDALFVGITFVADFATPFIPALIIGVVTFILVTLAMLFGKFLGKKFNKYSGWAGAVILFALAIKSLITAIIG